MSTSESGSAAPGTKRPRILVLESDPVAARRLAGLLEDIGCEPIVVAAVAEEAAAAAGEQGADLLVLAIDLPGSMDGIAAAREIRDRRQIPAVFVVAEAAEADGESLERAARCDPYGYLFSPYSARDVRLVIEPALGRLRAERSLRREVEEQAGILGASLDGFWVVDLQGRIREVNEAWCRRLGYTRDELLRMSINDIEVDESPAEVAGQIEQIRRTGAASLVRRQRRKDGGLIDVEISVAHLQGEGERFGAILRDVSDRTRDRELLAGQNRVLAKIAAGTPLAESLDDLLRFIESQAPEMLSSIQLLDSEGKRLMSGAAPSLPKGYIAAIDGAAVGPAAGSCGTAAFRRQPVIVEDIATDPLWENYRDLALDHGLHACWSTPIFDSEGAVLGTFAQYYRVPARPTGPHERLVEVATRVAALAISRERAVEALRRSETKFRTLYDAAPDGVLLLTEDGFIDCNRAALEMFGCATRAELYPKRPAELSPAIQPCGTDSETLAAERIAAALQEGTQRFEWVHKRTDSGTVFPAEVLLTAMDLDGKRVLQTVIRDISERRRVEDSLRENEDRLRDLLDNSLEIISTCDLEGNFLSVNATAARSSGYPREDLLKMNLAELIAPEVRSLFFDYLRTIVEEGKSHGMMRIITADGQRRYWEFDTTIRSEGVAKPIIRGMALDVTERRRAELALRVSHERFELASRATFNVIWDWDLEGQTLWRNDQFQTLFGYSRDEVGEGAESISRLVHPEDLARVQVGLREALESDREFWADHYRLRRKDGSYAAVEDRAFISRKADGSAVRMLGAMQDISERQRAEDSLRLQSGALQAAANSIVITDRQGVIEWANRAFATDSGYSLEEAVGRRPGDLLKSGRQGAAFYEDLWSRILAGEVWRGELVNRRKDGSLCTEEMTITPLKDASGTITHFVAVKQDVTQRKELEEQFRQAQKMEAVGRLAGGVAHDFNNMLGVILGYVGMALEQLDPSERLHADLLEVHKAAERSAGLTRQLLAFARKEPISPRVLDLNETVAGMRAMLTRLIDERIEITFEPARDLWLVQMDPSQADQILANLCVNARDSILDVGSISLSTANCVIDARDCERYPDAAPGDYVRLTVRDSGSGMEQEMLAQIFEPFFTTKSVGEGTGLGLPTVYGAVRQNGGFLAVASTLGEGTTFEVYLPRYRGPGEEVAGSAAEPSQHAGETILVVEDEPALLQLTARVLESMGYAVLRAHGATEALAIAEDFAGEIQLLLTDVVMPEMNGRQLAARLTSIRPRLQSLFMSGYAADVIPRGELENEVVHYLQKPFSQADLGSKVREVLGAAERR